MATLSSHLLNSVNGTHASGVKVIINQINSSGAKKIFFETESDEGGRISENFELSDDDCACDYEMICKIAEYFSVKTVVKETIYVHISRLYKVQHHQIYLYIENIGY